MTTHQYRTGDRVSVTGTVGAVIDGRLYIALDGYGSDLGSVYAYPDAVTLIEPVRPSEEWRPGDVVRNADDPDDKGSWAYLPSASNAGVGRDWLKLWGVYENDRFAYRGELPANLTLLVSRGRAVPQDDDPTAAMHPGPSGDFACCSTQTRGAGA